jgi:hemerythrin-like domain-containing protein
MPTSRSSSRTRSNARNAILQMLMDDHKRARKAFRDFEKLDASEDTEQCQALAQRTCGELQVHATLEEELFYPAVRSVLKEADLVEEAEVEHLAAKQLIEQLQTMTPEEAKFAATFKVLGEYVKHHVKEEEGEMFPRLERTRIDWEALHDRMNARRDELMEQFLPEITGMEEDAEATATQPAGAASRARPARRRAGAAAPVAGEHAPDTSLQSDDADEPEE